MSNNPENFLPPGFRFHPTDEELILHYLSKKAASSPCPVSIIAEVDIYKFDPWDLPAKAAFGEKEWYFFSPRDRKYPNGARPNRAAVSGYWKATGTDKPILASQGGRSSRNIGVKKALVFYKGRPPKGLKTNWIMHEYRLTEANSTASKPSYKYKLDSSMRLDDWVLCRIYKKSNSVSSTLISSTSRDHQEQEEPFTEREAPLQTFGFSSSLSSSSNFGNIQSSLKPQKSMSFSDLFDAMDYSALTRIMLDNNQIDPICFESSPAAAPILSNTNVHSDLDQTNSNTTTTSSGYIIQRQSTINPQLDSISTVVPFVENHHQQQFKRERSTSETSEEISVHPSKKFMNSCSFTNNTSSSNSTTSHLEMSSSSQFHLLNQPFFNQQLLLSTPQFQL